MKQRKWLDYELLRHASARTTGASPAQRGGADMPLRPKSPQEPRHELGRLFGDERNQLDLIDAIRRKP